MPFIQSNDIKIFYRVFQNGVESATINPTLSTMIVLHGAPGLIDHQIEVEAWKSFSNTVQVIFPDLRGCGQTEDGDLNQWSLKLCSEDLHTFCQKLGIHKPILAGISSGGFIIMHYLAKYADYPRGIILCNTEARKSPTERKKVFLRVGTAKAAEAAAIFDADPTSLEKSNAFFETCVPYFSKKPFSLMSPAKTNTSLWLKNSKEWSEIDFRENLKKIQCLTLYLAGTDDPNHPLASAIEAVNCIPKAFVHFDPIQDAGAPVYQDQPDAFEKRVSNFLALVKDNS
ncbi:MAG: alpha/beta hydrolase [Gammaproteobacteria bacterium]|nr:alpha/beta hydrolase [Gammaproteobacteria bacterium]